MVRTTPNEVVAPIHPNRMPTILAREDHAAWLEGTPEEALALIRPYPAERMGVIGRGEGMRAQPEDVAIWGAGASPQHGRHGEREPRPYPAARGEGGDRCSTRLR